MISGINGHFFQEKSMIIIIISTFFLRMITSIKLNPIKYKFYLALDLLAHHLSKIKYQTEFAMGSTIASVSAIINETSATNIKTVIAIAK